MGPTRARTPPGLDSESAGPGAGGLPYDFPGDPIDRLIAPLIERSLPLATLRWGVVAVVLYTAAAMLRSATRDATAAGAVPAVVEPSAEA